MWPVSSFNSHRPRPPQPIRPTRIGFGDSSFARTIAPTVATTAAVEATLQKGSSAGFVGKEPLILGFVQEERSSSGL